MARACYEEARADIICEPWDALPDWRKYRWRSAARAVLTVAETISGERLTAWRAARTRSVRVA